MTSTVCVLQCIAYLLEDLQIKFIQPESMYCDNASARHIATDHHFMSVQNTY